MGKAVRMVPPGTTGVGQEIGTCLHPTNTERLVRDTMRTPRQLTRSSHFRGCKALPSYPYTSPVTSLVGRSRLVLFLPLALGACPSDDSVDDTANDTGPVSTGAQSSSTGPAPSTSAEDTTSTGQASSSSSSTAAATDASSSGGSTEESGDSTTEGIQICGNNVIEGNELCDLAQVNDETCQSLGYQGGELGCLLTCDEYNLLGCFICGNDFIDIAEDCEGGVVPEEITCESLGYEGGALLCGVDCLYDTDDCSICGDGIRQGPESCDGIDLGGEDCTSLGLSGGSLACNLTGCSFDPTGCDIPGIPFGSDTGYTGYELPLGILSCDDISGTGTPTGLTDDSAQAVAIGFTFPFYGVDYTMVTIQSNGTLRWGDATYLSFGNTCLPTATNPSTNVLYVFWDDLNPGLGAGEVYYETLGVAGDQRMVIQWDTANYSGDAADLMRFQVVLHEATGFIDVCYVDTINAADIGNNGAEATAGIQQSSADGFDYSCNTPDLVDGLQLLYIPL
jgi:hypothetical protein